MPNTLHSKTNISSNNSQSEGYSSAIPKKVFVGMSGGVDSSVSAYLLKQQGYEVTGVFIKSWHPDFMPCNWKDERRDAMRVCAHLEIPFLTCDLEETYKKEVIDYMINEYKKGNTPNPDIMCNKEIKFGAFMKWALTSKEQGGQGADFIATGHYAQNINGELVVSKDSDKDQTYFLWTLTDEALKKVLFPVGHLDKSELRAIAKTADIPTFAKKDSQGICFLGKVDMKDFLKHYIPEQKGDVLNINGEIIGEHDGALFYTLGERHGFIINEKHKTNGDEPMYVISKDVQKNTITVSTKKLNEEKASPHIVLSDVDFRKPEIHSPKIGDTLIAEYRYHGQKINATFLGNNTYQFDMRENSTHTFNDIALGQSIVFYKDIETVGGKKTACIGGGIVVSNGNSIS